MFLYDLHDIYQVVEQNVLSRIFQWKLGLHWLPNANEINTKKHEMYMANAKILRLGPNATYIPLNCVGVMVR